MHRHAFPLFVLIATMAACQPDSRQDNRMIFSYNESKGIPTLDPAFARNQTIIWPVNQLFNGLLQLDARLQIKPCIARRWEADDTGTKYRFILRDDVYFHDHPAFAGGKGRKVVASDFVYSFNRILDPQTASPGAWIFHTVDKTDPDGPFRALNDSTLIIRLRETFPAFTGLLTMPYCFVVPREVVEYEGTDFRARPVGTGPFRFQYWKEDEKLVLRKNPRYFEKDTLGNRLPYLEAINIYFIRDKQSEFMEFMSGRLDFLSGVQAVYKDEMITPSGQLNPEHTGKVTMISQPYLNTEYLGFLLDTTKEASRGSPVLNRKVRLAINHGFDRAKMMKYLRNNIGTPAVAGFVPRGMPAYSESAVPGYRYDPDLARQYLEEAGHPGGKGLKEITLTTTADYLDLCEYIQHELAQIGIPIAIEVSTGASFRNRMANGQLEFFRGSWIADYPDAENYLSLFYSRNFSPSGPNYTHFSDPVYDSLYVRAVRTMDQTSRFRLYHRMDRMIVAESPVVLLFYDQSVRLVRKGLEGLASNPMNLLHLKHAYWTKTASR